MDLNIPPIFLGILAVLSLGMVIYALLPQKEDKRRKVELGQLKPQVWITAYPVPYESKELILEE